MENAIAYGSRVHPLADRAGDTETSSRALRTIAMAEALAGQPDGLDSSSKTLP